MHQTNEINLTTETSESELPALLEEKKFPPELCAFIMDHPNPNDLISLFVTLRRTNILNQTNIDAIMAHVDRDNLLKALLSLDLVFCSLHASRLFKFNIGSDDALISDDLAQTIFNAVITHNHPMHLVDPLHYLSLNSLLTPDNITTVSAYANPSAMADGLFILKQADMLTTKNRSALIAYPDDLPMILKTFLRTHMLTQENLDAVTTHTNPRDLTRNILILRNAGQLTQQSFNIVIARTPPAEAENAQDLWTCERRRASTF